jgi:hypothetical protein
MHILEPRENLFNSSTYALTDSNEIQIQYALILELEQKKTTIKALNIFDRLGIILSGSELN